MLQRDAQAGLGNFRSSNFKNFWITIEPNHFCFRMSPLDEKSERRRTTAEVEYSVTFLDLGLLD